jgi:hypothetical protein
MKCRNGNNVTIFIKKIQFVTIAISFIYSFAVSDVCLPMVFDAVYGQIPAANGLLCDGSLSFSGFVL